MKVTSSQQQQQQQMVGTTHKLPLFINSNFNIPKKIMFFWTFHDQLLI